MNGPPSILRDQVLAAAADRPSATRKTHQTHRLISMVLILLLIVGAGSLLAMRHGDVPDRPMAYLVTLISTCVIVVIATAYYTLGPTSSVLGRSSRFYRFLTIAIPILLALAALGANMIAPATLVGPNAPNTAYVACSTETFIAGAAVLAVLLLIERGSSTNLALWKGASFGAVAAAWATLFISISCPYAHPLHVMPTHILVPFVLLILGGMVTGVRYLSMRANRSS